MEKVYKKQHAGGEMDAFLSSVLFPSAYCFLFDELQVMLIFKGASVQLSPGNTVVWGSRFHRDLWHLFKEQPPFLKAKKKRKCDRLAWPGCSGPGAIVAFENCSYSLWVFLKAYKRIASGLGTKRRLLPVSALSPLWVIFEFTKWPYKTRAILIPQWKGQRGTQHRNSRAKL